MIHTTPPAPHACYRSIPAYYATNPHERIGFHTKVYTEGAYALVYWYGVHTGGETLFRRRGTQWCRLTGGGGAMNANWLVKYGVPRATAGRLIARLERGARQ